MRGYPRDLIDRVKRTGSHYLDPATLRFFNAYGGAILHRDRDTVVMVESIRFDHDMPREYRVAEFRFSSDGSSVEVERPTENYPTAARAVKAWRELSNT
jgi:hypothetical protein